MNIFKRKQKVQPKTQEPTNWGLIKSYTYNMILPNGERFVVGASKVIDNIIEGGADIKEVAVGRVVDSKVVQYEFFPTAYRPELGKGWSSISFVLYDRVVFLSELQRL